MYSVYRIPVEQRTPRGARVVAQLENLVSRVKWQSPDFSDLDVLVYQAHAQDSSYVIDISKGRFVRHVTVDSKTVQHLQSEHFDSTLTREIRLAMLTVARFSQYRK
jgi:hypothetical protein